MIKSSFTYLGNQFAFENGGTVAAGPKKNKVKNVKILHTEILVPVCPKVSMVKKSSKKNREFIQPKYLYLHDILVLLGGSTFHFHESFGKILGAYQVSRISSCIIPNFPSLTSTAKYILPFETIK